MTNQENPQQPEKRESAEPQFEIERGTPFRKKMLITKPVEIVDDRDQRKTLDAPAVVHVQKQDMNWTWLCNEEGKYIGKVSINNLDRGSTWSTRLALKPLTSSVAIYETAEDALSGKNPKQVLQGDDVVLPVMEIRMARESNLAYRVNCAIGEKGAAGKRGWVTIRSPKSEDLIFERGTLNTKEELSLIRSSVELQILELQDKIMPTNRKNIGAILERTKRCYWGALTGEEDRKFTQDTIKHANDTIGVGDMLQVQERTLCAKSAEDFALYLQSLKGTRQSLQLIIDQLPQSRFITMNVNGSKNRLYFTNSLDQ